MYYPYLRGRQFELIALRELSTENALTDYVLPIIEPVKKSLNSLTLANKYFIENNQPSYLVLNPSVGDFSGDHNYYADFLNDLEEHNYKPAFHYNNNSQYIMNIIHNYRLVDCLIIGNINIQNNDQEFKDLVESAQVNRVMINEPERNRDLKRYLMDLDKEFIRFDDLFASEPRNSNFLPIESHIFSQEHKYYSEENYDGFADFTPLSSEFVEGGSTPRAVVIHLTYLNRDDQIWISHFTSNTNDSIANVQGKFAEAAEKAVTYCRNNGLTNTAIQELETYFDEAHYPGLGTVKKIAIKNHLITVSQYLRSHT